MPFEKQSPSGGGRGRTTFPKISLRKSNSVGINSAAVEEYLEDRPEYCEVYFDPQERKLGLSFVEEETEDSFKVTYQESGATVAPTSVLKHFELVPDVTKQYEIEEQDLNDSTTLLVIDVDDHVATYGSPDSDDKQDEE